VRQEKSAKAVPAVPSSGITDMETQPFEPDSKLPEDQMTLEQQLEHLIDEELAEIERESQQEEAVAVEKGVRAEEAANDAQRLEQEKEAFATMQISRLTAELLQQQANSRKLAAEEEVAAVEKGKRADEAANDAQRLEQENAAYAWSISKLKEELLQRKLAAEEEAVAVEKGRRAAEAANDADRLEKETAAFATAEISRLNAELLQQQAREAQQKLAAQAEALAVEKKRAAEAANDADRLEKEQAAFALAEISRLKAELLQQQAREAQQKLAAQEEAVAVAKRKRAEEAANDAQRLEKISRLAAEQSQQQARMAQQKLAAEEEAEALEKENQAKEALRKQQQVAEDAKLAKHMATMERQQHMAKQRLADEAHLQGLRTAEIAALKQQLLDDGVRHAAEKLQQQVAEQAAQATQRDRLISKRKELEKRIAERDEAAESLKKRKLLAEKTNEVDLTSTAEEPPKALAVNAVSSSSQKPGADSERVDLQAELHNITFAYF
jgi:hypothetical protein